MVCKGTGKKKEIGPKEEKWVVGKKREGVDERKGKVVQPMKWEKIERGLVDF